MNPSFPSPTLRIVPFEASSSMSTRSPRLPLVASLGVAAVLCTLSLSAQEPKPADPAKAPAPAQAYDRARRVPPFFGQVGLTTEQRESIYKIRGVHQPKVDDLRKQVAAAEAAMLAECETVLTDAQKQLLNYRRQAAAEKRKSRNAAKTPVPPASDPAVKPGL